MPFYNTGDGQTVIAEAEAAAVDILLLRFVAGFTIWIRNAYLRYFASRSMRNEERPFQG